MTPQKHIVIFFVSQIKQILKNQLQPTSIYGIFIVAPAW